MAQYYDISLWQEHQQFNTGGTRNKSVYQNPDTELMYFFKTSLKKIKIDYKYKFWSEIIASELGHFLGFNILKYDIAFNGNDVGCISKSMVDQNQKESLIEGYKFLT
jgi:hypothetical protein